MSIILVGLLVVTVYLFYLYLTRHRSYFKDLGIPHSPQFPILGDMKDSIFKRKHISETIKEIYNLNKDAKYVGAYNFMSPIVVLRDPELVKSVTIKNFDHFVDRQFTMNENIDDIFSQFMNFFRGEKWKAARRLVTPVFTTRKIKAMFEHITPYSENFLNFIDSMSESERKMINTKDLFTKYANDVIATCAFGITIDSLKNPKNEFYTLSKEATNLGGSLLGTKMLISVVMPWLSRLFNVKLMTDEARSFFKNVVSTTMKTREDEFIKKPDLIQLLIEARGNTSQLLSYDSNYMTAQAVGFLFGGLETVSTQMCVLAHVLAINPEIQRKLQSEIDEVVQRTLKLGNKVTYEDINNMQYLDAVLNETLRRHPQAPVIDRLCTKSFELPPALPGLRPYTVKVGETIWLPVSGIHMDPKNYENPEIFDPDRFLEKKITTSQAMNLGFGIGPRSCIGMRFATLEVKVLMFYLLSRFSIKKNEKTADPYVYKPEVHFIASTLTPKDGFWVALEKRQ